MQGGARRSKSIPQHPFHFLYLVTNEFIRASSRIPGLKGPHRLPLIANLAPIREMQPENIASVLFGRRPEFYNFHKVTSTAVRTSPYGNSLKRRTKGGSASALNRSPVDSYVLHLDVESKATVVELYTHGNGGNTPLDSMAIMQQLREDLFDEITEVEEEVSKFRSTTGNLQDYIRIVRLNPLITNFQKAEETKDRRDKYLNSLSHDLEDRTEIGIRKSCTQVNVILIKEAKLNSEELTYMILTMSSDGLDTVTTLVAWSISLLTQRPNVQDKALMSTQEIYRSSAIRYITYDSEIFPKRTVIFLNLWTYSMHPEVWSDPGEFRPERWFEQPDTPMFTYEMSYCMCVGSLFASSSALRRGEEGRVTSSERELRLN
ncbi:cytochrome P450 [Aspergillus varians]